MPEAQRHISIVELLKLEAEEDLIWKRHVTKSSARNLILRSGQYDFKVSMALAKQGHANHCEALRAMMFEVLNDPLRADQATLVLFEAMGYEMLKMREQAMTALHRLPHMTRKQQRTLLKYLMDSAWLQITGLVMMHLGHSEIGTKQVIQIGHSLVISKRFGEAIQIYELAGDTSSLDLLAQNTDLPNELNADMYAHMIVEALERLDK